MERGGHQREGMVAYDMGRPAGEREGSPGEKGRSPEGGGEKRSSMGKRGGCQ